MIRRFDPDAPAVYRAIRLEALQASPDAFASTYERERAFTDDFIAERLRSSATFGWFVEDRAVAMAGFFRQTGEKSAHKGMLWGMYVSADHRGKGIGRALTEAVVAHARTEVEILQLSCVSTNESARRLYERMGFVVYGTERDALKVGGAYHDELLMALAL